MFTKIRYDGTYISNINFFTQITPYIKPAKLDSVIFFEQEYSVSRTMQIMQERNLTMTEIMLYAALRTIAVYPKINRFVSGLRYYQRNRIAFSFEKENDMSATMSFSPLLTFENFSKKITEYGTGSEKKEAVKIDGILPVLKKLPRFLIRFFIWGLKFCDYHNGLHKSFITNLPYFSSMILTETGSMDLDASYYHNFDIGNCGIFCTVGKVKQTDTGSKVKVSFSFDGRIADPAYCAQALEMLKDLTENPEKLFEPFEMTTEQFVKLGLTEKELNDA